MSLPIMNVLIPDKASGDAYCQALHLALPNLIIRKHYAHIRPRVIDQRRNSDPGVAHDLAQALTQIYQCGGRLVSISCNTLQLWLDQAHDGLSQAIQQQLKVMTTVAAYNWKYASNREVVWMGTNVFCQSMQQLGYTTLYQLNQPGLQNLTQELIWRLKAVYKMDYSTAGNIISVNNLPMLNQRADLLFASLSQLNIQHILMACTELPLLKTHLKRTSINMINPATLIAEQLLSLHSNNAPASNN